MTTAPIEPDRAPSAKPEPTRVAAQDGRVRTELEKTPTPTATAATTDPEGAETSGKPTPTPVATQAAAATAEPKGQTGADASQGSDSATQPNSQQSGTEARVSSVVDSRGNVYSVFESVPKDGIPSIDSPRFITATDAGPTYGEHDLVIGLSINGDHRVYSMPFLSSHEIVNDVVGGKPVTVTW